MINETEIYKALSPQLQDAIRQLYYRQSSYSDCFSNMLYDLIAKADPANRARLSKGFPEYVLAFQMWAEAPLEGEFFLTFGFKMP